MVVCEDHTLMPFPACTVSQPTRTLHLRGRAVLTRSTFRQESYCIRVPFPLKCRLCFFLCLRDVNTRSRLHAKGLPHKWKSRALLRRLRCAESISVTYSMWT